MASKNPEQVVVDAGVAFLSGKTKSITFREKQLRALYRMYDENTNAIVEALEKDLRRPKAESILFEIEILKNELRTFLIDLRKWAQPESPDKEIANMLDTVKIYSEPYGVVLVIGAWNYPILLTMSPVVGAIAAGNCVIIKPSEIAEASAKFMAETLPKYLDEECYQVYLGGVAETTALLKHKFDYIFFTGSTSVGRIVHAAAAQHLTPTTLELGGKSPVFLDDTTNIEVATRRILWGKWANAGQTCIAPDFLICSKEVREKFLKAAEKVLKEWYRGDPKQCKDYSRIINDRNYNRLVKLMKDGRVALGGSTDASERFIELTVLVDVKLSDSVMDEEVFGPILPIYTVAGNYEAMKTMEIKGKPLALYIFSTNRDTINMLMSNTSSGACVVNDVIMHFPIETLPFGGVGQSGMGLYHGKYSFDTFSHKRAYLEKDYNPIMESLAKNRYPPYTAGKLNFLNMLLKKRRGLSFKSLSNICIFVFGCIAVLSFQVISNYFKA